MFSWCEKDHGNSKDHPLDWAREQVSKNGGDASGKILLHCFPKIFGHVFNPLSVYFCFNKKQKFTNHWAYEIENLGYKYNMNDFMASVGLVQLKKINKLYLFRALLKLTPIKISNYIYDLIANNRYLFFNKTDNCQITQKNYKSKIIS